MPARKIIKRFPIPDHCPGLARLYGKLNRKYFGGKLPRVTIGWSKHIGTNLGVSTVNCKRPVIRLLDASKDSERIWLMTLLHEMCHIATRKEATKNMHGPKWQKEMRRLARLGAFDKLW